MKLFKKRESILARYAKAEFEALARQNAAKPPEERALISDFACEITSFLSKLERKLGGESGASMGFTAPMIASAVKYLMRFEPIAPLEDREEDWHAVYEDRGEIVYQHTRCSKLFKRNGQIKFIDAITFVEPSGAAFSGMVEGLSSQLHVRKMPFMPETFYVHVYERACPKEHPQAYRRPGTEEYYFYKIADRQELELPSKLYEISPEILSGIVRPSLIRSSK